MSQLSDPPGHLSRVWLPWAAGGPHNPRVTCSSTSATTEAATFSKNKNKQELEVNHLVWGHSACFFLSNQAGTRWDANSLGSHLNTPWRSPALGLHLGPPRAAPWGGCRRLQLLGQPLEPRWSPLCFLPAIAAPRRPLFLTQPGPKHPSPSLTELST